MTDAGKITAIIDGDTGPLTSALNQAKGQATAAASGIEGSFKKGFGSGIQSGISGVLSSMGPLGNGLAEVASGFSMTGLAAAGAVVGVAALGAASVSTAANWQSLMAGVSKTTGVEGSGLEKLSSDLQNIRMETGATAEGIASAVTTAGSIGIPTDELAGFTEVAMQMGSAFSMSAESASEAMGKIGNVVKPAEMSWTKFATKAGSSVNALADSMATSETEILTGMTHLGAVMGLLKPPADTLPAWQAMVATIQSLGLAGDQAGEAIQDALMYATKDAKGGISGLLGMTGEELQLNLRTNAPEVMQQAAVAIASLPLEEQGEALAAFGSTGSKAIALLMGDLDPASGKFTKLGEAIETSNSAWKEGTGLAESYAKSQENFNTSLDRLGASLDVAGQKLGSIFLPALTTGVDLLTAGVQAATGFGEALYDMVAGGAAILGELFNPETWMKTPEEFLASIDSAFLSAMGVDLTGSMYDTGKEAGDQIANGVNDSDLPKAPGKALSSPEAKAAAGEAGKELAEVVFDEKVWALAAQDTMIAAAEASAGYNRPEWKNKQGTTLGVTESGDLSTTWDLTKNHSYIVLRDKDGNELDREDIYGEDASTAAEAVRQMVERNGFDVDQINQYLLVGDTESANRLQLTENANLDVVLDTYLDFSQNMEAELTTAGEDVGAAYLKGIVPDAATVDAHLQALKKLQLYDPEEAERQGADHAIYYLQALNTAIKDYEEAKVQYQLTPDPQALAALKITQERLQEQAKNYDIEFGIKVEVDTSLLGTAKEDIAAAIDLKSITANNEAFSKALNVPFQNQMDFLKNEWQPALEAEIQWYEEQFSTGMPAAIEQTTTYLDAMVAKVQEMPDLFTSEQIEILRDYHKGLIDVAEAMDRLSGKAAETKSNLDQVAQGTQLASVGYNQLAQAVTECEECVMSDFGAWQEAQTDLFNPSYIGAGGQAYTDWKNDVVSAVNEASAAVTAAGGVALGAGAQPQTAKITLQLDDTQAKTQLTAFETDAKKEAKKPLALDSEAATKSLADVETAAKKSVSKPLLIDSSQAMSAIAAIDAAASAPVIKIVYVQEVASGSSGSSSSAGSATWTPTTESGDPYTLPPIFMARGGYVDRPTLAVIGEGGPEVVVPLEKLQKSVGGGVTITINSPITVNGSGGADFEAALEERNRRLVDEIVTAVNQGG